MIRWAFEKQGVFRATGAPVTAEGKPPAVDVYIDDGRHGEYPFQPNHWSCTDIWNRTTAGAGGGGHQEPIVGRANYAYVRIKNRGTTQATNVIVKGFHCLPGVGLEFPTDWVPMTTAQLTAPNLAANDSVGVVVGPFSGCRRKSDTSACSSTYQPGAMPATSTVTSSGRFPNGGWFRTTTTSVSGTFIRSRSA